MIPVHVSGGELSDKERKAYIDRAIEKYPNKAAFQHRHYCGRRLCRPSLSF